MSTFLRPLQCLMVSVLVVILVPAPGICQTNRIKPTAEHLCFKCKLLINPSTKSTIADAIIETNGGKILRVGKAIEFSVPSNAKVLDFSDKCIIPGLIDTHGHLYARTRGNWRKTDPLLPIFHLAAGITAVAD